MAQLTAELLAEGKAKFPDGRELEITPRDWLDLMKWVYAQVDGPPKQDDTDRLSDEELIAAVTKAVGGGSSPRAGAAGA